MITLAEIAIRLGATLEGDGSLPVTRIAHPSHADGAGCLVLAMAPDLLALLKPDHAPAVAITADAPAPAGFAAVLRVRWPKAALALLTSLFETPRHAPAGVHSSAVIDTTATIGPDCAIGPRVVIGPGAVLGARCRLLAGVVVERGAVLGDDCLVHSQVVIGERVRIGARTIIQAGAVIGSDGFSFATAEPGSIDSARQHGDVRAANTVWQRTASLGTVIVGDDCEIGANSCLDRGTLLDTIIGQGVKIDNLVQIAHNVRIGDHSLVCGQVGIAGSSAIGARVVLAGGVGVADHVQIGDDAIVTAASKVGGNIAPRSVAMGYPAIPRAEFVEQYAAIRRLKQMQRRLEALEAALRTLEPAAKSD